MSSENGSHLFPASMSWKAQANIYMRYPLLTLDQVIQSQVPQNRTNSHSLEDIHHYEWQRLYISEPICQMTNSATP